MKGKEIGISVACYEGEVRMSEFRIVGPGRRAVQCSAVTSEKNKTENSRDSFFSMRSSSSRERNGRGSGSAFVRSKSLREHLQMADEDAVVDSDSVLGGGGGVVGDIYHERQRLQLCLLHSLNNLLQGKDPFTRKELDDIADNLATISSGGDRWRLFSLIFKRHRNSMTGDYDANVLIAALASRGKEVRWYDRRKGVEGLNVDEYGSQLAGIIVNVPSRRFLNLWKGRHWIALRMINGRWYNLDSDFNTPRAFDHGEVDLKRYLAAVLAETGEVLIIVEGDGAK